MPEKQDYTPPIRIEGVEIYPLMVHQTDDGSFVELGRFENEEKLQINQSILMPGAIKAFHLHAKQIDRFSCLQPLLIGLHDMRPDSPTFEKTMRFMLWNQVLVIPKMVAHGVANLSHEPRLLTYMVDNFFNPEDPDEMRVSWNYLGADFWQMTKG